MDTHCNWGHRSKITQFCCCSIFPSASSSWFSGLFYSLQSSVLSFLSSSSVFSLPPSVFSIQSSVFCVLSSSIFFYLLLSLSVFFCLLLSSSVLFCLQSSVFCLVSSVFCYPLHLLSCSSICSLLLQSSIFCLLGSPPYGRTPPVRFSNTSLIHSFHMTSQNMSKWVQK